MKIRAPFVIVAFLACAGATAAQETVDLDSVEQKFSYAMGLRLGQSLKSQGLEKIDSRAFAAGVDDSISGRGFRVPPDELSTAVQTFQQQMQQEKQAKADRNLAAAETFLSQNRKKEGVVELPSGLQYRVLEEGDGAQPAESDSVTVHYRGTLIDGEEFDSSYSRGEPAKLKIDQVIEGWQQALPMMHVGSKWRIFVPPKLAYGERGAGSVIGPNETLIFDIELLGIN